MEMMEILIIGVLFWISMIIVVVIVRIITVTIPVKLITMYNQRKKDGNRRKRV